MTLTDNRALEYRRSQPYAGVVEGSDLPVMRTLCKLVSLSLAM